MALKNFTEQELNLPFSLNYAEFCKIIERQQIKKAKRQATKKERANTTLTAKQKLIAWTQIGGIVKYKAISYTEYQGNGVLMVNNKPHTIFASFSDFVALCRKVYGLDGVVSVQAVKP
jgi:hypothetical protein